MGNAITHFVTGFCWTMIGTSWTRWIREWGILLWMLTIVISIGLLSASIFVE